MNVPLAGPSFRDQRAHGYPGQKGAWYDSADHRRLGLLINALLTLFILIGVNTSVGGPTLYLVTGEVVSLLLIVGLLAIWTIHPTLDASA